MHADDVALGGIAHGAHDGTANLGVARAPDHRGSRLAALGGVSVQSDVSHVLSDTQRAGKRCILSLVDEERKTPKEAFSDRNHAAFGLPRPPLRLWANISFVVTGRRYSHQPACLATMRAKSSACATGDFDFLVRWSAPASKAAITASWT